MAGFQSINTGGRSTSSYEEDDDEFSSYDPESAGSRTRRGGGGFSSLDASAYEARRRKCKRVACMSVSLAAVVVVLVLAYNVYQGNNSPGSWNSDASANYNTNYTPSYGAPADGEGQDEIPMAPADGVPPMPTVDLMGLCAEEYIQLHGNIKCKENCVAGQCCFLESVDDNCNHLDGADVICNMYSSCKDVMDQPDFEVSEPEDTYYEDMKEIENLYYGGEDEFDMDEDEDEYAGDDDEYGDDDDEFADGDDYGYDEYGAGEGADEYGMGEGGDDYGYGYDSKSELPEITIDGGEMPVVVTEEEEGDGTTDFEHDFDGTLDAIAPSSVCGRLDLVTNEQSCSEAVFCESDDDCLDPDYPTCMEGCGDEFQDAMEEIMEAVEENLPPELKSYCASMMGEDGLPSDCDASAQCIGDEDCPEGFQCSSECGAALYEDSEGDEALGVCGISSADGEPSCSPDGVPCFNNDDCENNSDGTFAECLIECNTDIMDQLEEDLEGLGDSSEVEVETEAEAEAEEEALEEAIEEYYDEENIEELENTENAEDLEIPEELEIPGELDSVMELPEEESTIETEEPTDEYSPEDEDTEEVDENDTIDELDSEVMVEQVVPPMDEEMPGIPGGMPPVEGFEGELPEAVEGFCGRIKANGDLECTGTDPCEDDDSCPGKELCLSGCAPTRN